MEHIFPTEAGHQAATPHTSHSPPFLLKSSRTSKQSTEDETAKERSMPYTHGTPRLLLLRLVSMRRPTLARRWHHHLVRKGRLVAHYDKRDMSDCGHVNTQSTKLTLRALMVISGIGMLRYWCRWHGATAILLVSTLRWWRWHVVCG